MDLLLHHGIIHTMDPACPTAQAVRIINGRYTAVGDNETLLAQAGPDTVLTDLAGAAVYPGMVDSHLHILTYAIYCRELLLTDVRSRAEALAAIAERVSQAKPGQMINARGFNEDLWEDNRLITREDLDAVAPDNPVRLTRVCGHMVIANSAAMAAAGITAETPVPDGGSLDHARGIFCENALALLYGDEEDSGSVEECMGLLEQGMQDAADTGLTGLWSDDLDTGYFDMHTVLEAYRRLDRAGRMPLRVVEQCALANDDRWHSFRAAGNRYGQGTDMFRIGPRKLYTDGSLGARTACLSIPYADAPDRQGVPIYAPGELARHAAAAHAAGTPFIVHAIGDAGVDSVLDAIEYARAAVPGTDDLPSGIVHCQITRPEQLQRIAALHAAVYAQPVFTEYDLHICRDRVGETLEKSSYNWKTLLSTGVCISSGSDSPVEPFDPAKNIYCAVTRQDFDHKPAGGWLPEQCLTVEEAVRCHTVEAARAVGYEDRLGRIAPGFLADATVFPADLAAIAPDDILTQQPLFTLVGGIRRDCCRK